MTPETLSILPQERIERTIYIVRGSKVLIDEDLALLYGIATKTLNKAITRNQERFPDDFMFQLNKEELKSLRFQIGTSKKGRGGRRYLPYVFTEQGVAMLSSVLRTPRAITINIEIMRAFVRLRQALSTQEKLTKAVLELKDFVLKNSHKNNREFQRIWQAIEKLSKPLTQEEEDRHRIGFDVSNAAKL